MFWSRNKQDNRELAIQTKTNELEIKALKDRFDMLEQKFTSLRGLVNKKLYLEVQEEVKKEVKSEQPQDLNPLVPKFL
jgi:hypothetical protein